MIPIGETEEIEDEKTLNIHEATKRKYQILEILIKKLRARTFSFNSQSGVEWNRIEIYIEMY